MTSETDYAEIYDALASRRKFLAGTAAIGATALAGCSGGSGSANTENGEKMAAKQESTNPDVDVLNYALTLEHLEHAFYREALKTFTDEDLRNAEQVANFGDQVRSEVPRRLDNIRAHEQGHVAAIEKTIEDLGGKPVGEANYTFDFGSAKKFLATAKVLENTGVAAYKGAAPAINNNKILAPALGIHSVEARHASFLNAINVSSPFPAAFDAPKTPEKVVEAANPFFEADISGSVSMSQLVESDPTADRKKKDDTSDLKVLNYALTLEHLEHAFYRDGLKKFSEDEIRTANVLSKFGDEVKQSAPKRLASVRDHEKAHVDVITKTVEKLGGDPVSEASYTFDYESPSEFIATARVLENTGVAAYAGAAPTVKNDKVFVAAAKIHSVEARHAGFLNELNGKSPYPRTVDEAKSMKEVKEAVKPFIEGM